MKEEEKNMKDRYAFGESAARAGYPYTMETSAEMDGKIDAVIFTSYKTARDAYKDAARRLKELAEVYEDEEHYVYFNASVMKTEFLYDRLPWYTHVCLLSRFDKDRIYCAGGAEHHNSIVRDKRRKA